MGGPGSGKRRQDREPEVVALSIKVSRPTFQRLLAVAADEQTSVAGIIRSLLEHKLAEREIEARARARASLPVQDGSLDLSA